ncbi:MAG TPA: flagellar hook assembly protein FlgD [Steroidobacteraceae bacterium]|nr:flagellar hook assembly protein FlgD [Steroidobacteraceae bacterium]
MSITDVIAGTQGSSGAQSANAAGTKKKDQLGQNEFMQLMLAQLKNQDPFKSMDPSQFLGQLAQFGTVTGIQDMQKSFTALSDSMRSAQVLDGATMVGRDILVASEDANLGVEGGMKGAIDVPSGTTSLQLAIKDSSGQLIRRMTLPTASGLSEFSWDGIADNGTRAAAGDYTFEAVANVSGQSRSLETLMSGRVNSVTIDSSNNLVLNTSGLGSRSLSDVRRIM